MEGWIKLHRKILNWEWFTTPHMLQLFVFLLLTANRKKGKWKGIEVDRGQVVTGLNSLKKSTGISIRSLRTCISRLKSTGEITVKTTSKYSIITICNYDTYNGLFSSSDNQNDNQADTQPTSNRQQTRSIENIKEEENKSLVDFSKLKKEEDERLQRELEEFDKILESPEYSIPK